MDKRKLILLLSTVCGLLSAILCFVCLRIMKNKEQAQPAEVVAVQPSATEAAAPMLVRLSVIEVYPEYLEEYLNAAATVGGESVEKEPGVVCIFPAQLQKETNQIRILEIYRNQEAYQHHIQTEHFQTYKQGTLHMVKSLDLQDMTPLHPEAMPLIFKKFFE